MDAGQTVLPSLGTSCALVKTSRDYSVGFPLIEGRVVLIIGKKIFPVREIRCWHRLTREAVAGPSLQMSKASWVRGDLKQPSLVKRCSYPRQGVG